MKRLFAVSACLGVLALGLPGGLPPADASAPVQHLVRNVTGWDDQRVVIPAHAPLPDPGNGIGPGSRLILHRPDGAFLCTANFVWTNGQKQYLGTAGHCVIPDGLLATHGPDADYNPANTTVEVCTANCLDGEGIFGTDVTIGPVVYGRRPPVDTFGPDFGLVEIPAALAAQVRPSMPMWGGPTSSVANANAAALKPLCHYGNGTGVGAVYPTKGRAGLNLGGNTEQWAAILAAAPGDSGSAVVVCGQDGAGVHGQGALGVLTTISIGVPNVTIKGTTVGKAITMATEANLSISLVLGV